MKKKKIILGQKKKICWKVKEKQQGQRSCAPDEHAKKQPASSHRLDEKPIK